MESFSRVVSYFSKFLQFYSGIRHIIHALLYLALISIIRARIRQLRHILSTSYASTSVLK